MVALLFFLFNCFLSASMDVSDQSIDLVQYREIEEECYRVIRNVHRNLYVLEWSDALVKEILKINLEGYLMDYLNTPESHKLYTQYVTVDWKIEEMMKMHFYEGLKN